VEELDLKTEKDNFYISLDVVENPNCPAEILIKVLRRKYTNLISMYAAKNPNCPPEILAEVLRRGNDDGVSQCAVRNPNCPIEMLKEVLDRENDDWVSKYASQNPNCPLEAKIKWMQAVGRIGKEDPSVHIIEYENKKEDDFQDLRDLL